MARTVDDFCATAISDYPLTPMRAGGLCLSGEDGPFAGDALEYVAAAVGERDAGPGDEVTDGRGCKDLVGRCLYLGRFGMPREGPLIHVTPLPPPVLREIVDGRSLGPSAATHPITQPPCARRSPG
jgi:hypothetical protein